MLDSGNMGFEIKRSKRLDGELAVGPSLAMSNFCYSIFRLDPYVGCQHSCTYCYTRFLPGKRPSTQLAARVDYPRLFRRSIGVLRQKGIRLPPFRMSALTDPFQPVENRLKLSLELMKVARNNDVPLIVSTKSTLTASSPWLDELKELADEGLVVVQLSIAFLDETVSRRLEPGAPSPSDRLRVAEVLSAEGIPVVLRFQPLVPYLNSSEEHIERYVEEAKAVGAKHIIAEALRISSWKNLELFSRIIDKNHFDRLKNRLLWEHYPKSSQKHPNKEWRLRTYTFLSERVFKNGLGFGLCREGFYSLNKSPDCCGIYLLRKKVLRWTLYELLYGQRPGYEYLSREEISLIPLAGLRRKLERHWEIILETASNKKLLRELTDSREDLQT